MDDMRVRRDKTGMSSSTLTTRKIQNDYTDKTTPDVALPLATSKEQTMFAEIGIAAVIALTPLAAASGGLSEPQMEFRDCVAYQESRGSYTATNQLSSAEGKFQFLDNKWRHGLAHMVADAMRDHGMPWSQAKKVRTELRDTPIRKWHPMMQEIGFATVLNAHGDWSGWRHWYLPGSRCNSLVPVGAR